MTRLKDTIKWRDVSAGNLQKVSSDITISSAIPFSMNILFDKVLGEGVSREGTAIVGVQMESGMTCRGLYQHLDSVPAENILFAVFNGTIYNVASGASMSGSLTASADANFATFLNTTMMLNGTEKRVYTSAAGWLSSGSALDASNVPAGGKFPIEFKDRMYAAVTDRLYYTNTVTGGAVSWTDAGSGSLQVEQEDGGGTLQALSKVPGYLLIYKQRSLKRWNFDSSFPEDLISVGTQSHKSVVRARGKNYFFYGPNGFYETAGDYPKLISRPVQRIVEGMASSFYSSVNGWSDDKNVYWSIGDITVDFDRGYTETYANVVLRYTIDTQQWAPLQYVHEFHAMHQYISGSDTLIIAGNTNGQVLQLNVGNSDYGGVPIKYILQSPEFDFKNREYFKTINDKIFVHSDRTQGAEIQRRLDYGNWESFGTLNDVVTEVPIRGKMRARVFEFRLVDSITGEQVKLRGLDFPNVDVELSST